MNRTFRNIASGLFLLAGLFAAGLSHAGESRVLVEEDFNAGAYLDNGWSVTNLEGAGTWTMVEENGRTSSYIMGMEDGYVGADSDANYDEVFATLLVSPEFSLAGATSASLAFLSDFQKWETDLGVLRVTTDGGETWTDLYTLLEEDGTFWEADQIVVDLAAFAGETLQLGWYYSTQETSWQWHWYIDNVLIDAYLEADFSEALAQATDPYAIAVLGRLQQLAEVATGDFLDQMIALSAQTEELGASLEDGSPGLYAALQNISLDLSQASAAVVRGRLNALQVAKDLDAEPDENLMYAAAGEMMTDTGPMPLPGVKADRKYSLWARAYKVDVDRDNSEGFTGYDFESDGLSLGIDRWLSDNLVVGLVLGASEGDVHYVQADTDVETRYGGLYAGYLAGDFYIHGQAAWYRSEYETRRDTTLFGTAVSSTDGEEYALSGQIEYLDLKLGTLNVVPTIGFDYAHYEEDGFTEEGSLLDLTAEGYESDAFSSRIGLRVNSMIEFGSMVLVPELRAEWIHEMGETANEVQARFAGSEGETFTVDGVDPIDDTYVVGATLTQYFGDRVALFGEYNTEFGDDFKSWDLSGGLKVFF